ncbi:MAG: hypothetical protein A4S09_05535 [Proteobacteria bacterium SG_bin7]|nr:MAG: hypothetical protein A4S09_05535 [Proteobacteria bacterium SG_bin7]
MSLVLNPLQNCLAKEIKLPKKLSVGDIKKQFPGARVLKVSPEEFEVYKRRYAENVPVVVPVANRTYNPCSFDKGYQPGSLIEQKAQYYSEHPEPMPGLDFDTNWWNWSGSSSDGKEILVIVAVIGVVVVAALVVYSVSYIVTMAQAGFKCEVWRDLGARFSYVQDNSNTQIRSGRMNGLYYSQGFIVPFGVMGLTGEVGQHDLNMTVKATSEERQFKGAYFLAGPSFTIPFGRLGGPAFQIELLAGTSSESNIGLMSTLRLGVEFNIENRFSLGLNIGAALINVRDFDNYIRDNDQLNFLSGMATSFRW